MSLKKKLGVCVAALLLLASCGKSADELFEEGRALMDDGNFADAIPLIESAINKAPTNTAFHNAFGVALLRIDSATAAVSAFNRAIEVDTATTKNYRPFYNRGNAKRVLGDDQGAMDDYNKAIELAPAVADAYANRGAIYAKYQDFDNALFDFEYALGLNDQNPLVFMNKGKIELRIDNVEDAIFDFKKAITLKEDLAEAWYWMGLAEITRENISEGCAHLQTAAENGLQQASTAYSQNCLQ